MLVILAKIIAHVGNFENRSFRGGNLELLDEELVFPAWISRSSDLVMKLLSCGSLVTLYDHVSNQSNPIEEKRMKGPEMPIEESITGVNNKPMTLPR